MEIHPLAGKPAPAAILVDVPRLISAYYTQKPDASQPDERVAFGTSGHRGSAERNSFNEAHLLAITQAICEYRQTQGISGPLFLGVDTHALSEPARRTVLEVLAGNGVETRIAQGGEFTPTPVVSHAILTANRGRTSGLADGIILTPSHNPPEDGGCKYNPPHGGPADTAATRWIEKRANALLATDNQEVQRVPFARALRAAMIREHDFLSAYVADLAQVVDLEVIRGSGLKLAVDPMGGAGRSFWAPIANRYGLDLTVVQLEIDPTFRFMTVDRDGKIRMDCSSPWAMAGLIARASGFDLAFGNDPDNDRHGIVTRQGLLNPNHYLAVAIWYLCQHRPGWRPEAMIGKTLVSSSLIDRVTAHLGRPLLEVPVGFKWFVPGLLDGSCGCGGEESAGASFLRHDGTVWTTDKDGFILDLLAAELTARTGRDPAEHYAELAARFGEPCYERIDAPADARQKAILQDLAPEAIRVGELAGEKILAKLTRAPGNGAPIGGLKVVTENGWFAARPSGTEDVYKIYAESFLGPQHLAQIQEEARQIVSAALVLA